jgi:hypothetical protein
MGPDNSHNNPCTCNNHVIRRPCYLWLHPLNKIYLFQTIDLAYMYGQRTMYNTSPLLTDINMIDDSVITWIDTDGMARATEAEWLTTLCHIDEHICTGTHCEDHVWKIIWTQTCTFSIGLGSEIPHDLASVFCPNGYEKITLPLAALVETPPLRGLRGPDTDM